MNKKILFIIIVQSLFLIENIFAQVTFQKTYGGSSYDYAYCVKQTFDGGYIITGSSNSFGFGGDNVYLLKTDTMGDILWTKIYVGRGWGKFVEQTNDSGFIIACHGFFSGAQSVFLIKTNSIGDTLWTRSFGTPSNGLVWEMPFSVQQTNDGGYIIGAYGTGGACLIKTDIFGDTTWTKKIEFTPWGGSFGSTFDCTTRQTNDGGYMVGSNDHGLSTDIDFALAKTDNSGNILWSKVYGSLAEDHLKSMNLTTDGGYIMVGYTNGFGAGGNDIYLIKTDSLGVVSWSKTYGSVIDEFGYYVQQTSDGGYIVSGTSDNKVCVIKTDSNGSVLWSDLFLRVYNYATYVDQTSDSGFIICNSTPNWTLEMDMYLIKTDANGNSGCNQSSYLAAVSSPPTFSSAKTFNTSSGCGIINVVFQTSSGGAMTQSCLTIGIDEAIHNNLINVYPNPATDKFSINANSEFDNAQLNIFNTMGHNVYSCPLTQETIVIDAENFSSGIYYLQIIKGEKMWAEKIIKQ